MGIGAHYPEKTLECEIHNRINKVEKWVVNWSYSCGLYPALVLLKCGFALIPEEGVLLASPYGVGREIARYFLGLEFRKGFTLQNPNV